MQPWKIILLGLGIFAIGEGMEVNLILYSGIPLVIGTALSWFGAFTWLRVKENRIKYKDAVYPRATFPEMVKQLFDLSWSRISLIWATVALVFMAVTHVGSLMMKNTDVYGAAVESVKNDKELSQRLGEIKGYSYQVSGTVRSRGDSRLYFGVIGSKERFWVKTVVDSYNDNLVTRSVVVSE